MDSGEPDLFDVLWFGVVRQAEPVVHILLGLIPRMQPKHSSTLVDRNRLTEHLHAGILLSMRQLLKTECIKSVRPRDDNTRNRVPDPHKRDRGPSRRSNSS